MITKLIQGETMSTVDIRMLSFGAKAGICWSAFWRGILVTVGSMLTGGVLGGVVGGIMGFVLSLAGIQMQTIQSLAMVVGVLLGLSAGGVFLYIYIRWLLASNLGGYRLVLVEANTASNQ